MRELKLTARAEGRNDSHSRIGVFQNGGKAGVLTVDAEQEQAVVALIGTATELLAALKELMGQCCGPTIGDGHWADGYHLAREDAKAAIAKAEGGQ